MLLPVLLSLVFLWAVLVTEQASGAWQQPLSEDELSQAIGIALTDSDAAYQSLQGTRRAAQVAQDNSAVHPLGIQVLLAERKEVKNAAANANKYAEVFLFDYALGKTLLKLIDIDQGIAVETRTVNSVHLPLTDAEIQYAKSLMLNNAELDERVNTELAGIDNDGASNATGSTQTGLASLDARVSIWVPGLEQASRSHCDRERCALVSLFTNDDYSLSVEPMVNLSTGEVSVDLFQ